MRWSHRNIMIGTSAAIGLVASLVVVLGDRGVPAVAPAPGRSAQLYSPLPASR